MTLVSLFKCFTYWKIRGKNNNIRHPDSLTCQKLLLRCFVTAQAKMHCIFWTVINHITEDSSRETHLESVAQCMAYIFARCPRSVRRVRICILPTGSHDAVA